MTRLVITVVAAVLNLATIPSARAFDHGAADANGTKSGIALQSARDGTLDPG
jgi:hypothetical protein